MEKMSLIPFNILSKSYSLSFANMARNYLLGRENVENINFAEHKPKCPLGSNIYLIFLAMRFSDG